MSILEKHSLPHYYLFITDVVSYLRVVPKTNLSFASRYNKYIIDSKEMAELRE